MHIDHLTKDVMVEIEDVLLMTIHHVQHPYGDVMWDQLVSIEIEI
jgi:hypothetical protein